MSANTIRYGWRRPQALPADFIMTPVYIERTTVAEKREGNAISAAVGGYGAASGSYHTSPAYFIFVMTPHGDLRITVSNRVFDLLRVGDLVVVKYQQGRWTPGALKGVIAN